MQPPSQRSSCSRRHSSRGANCNGKNGQFSLVTTHRAERVCVERRCEELLPQLPRDTHIRNPVELPAQVIPLEPLSHCLRCLSLVSLRVQAAWCPPVVTPSHSSAFQALVEEK
ncbi:hypothetical protein Esti_001336 [Eimeria stiedai]